MEGLVVLVVVAVVVGSSVEGKFAAVEEEVVAAE